MNRNLTAALSRGVRLTLKRADHHHHGPVNHGPPITMDYMPIPKYSYDSVHGKLQQKFNRYLATAAVVFAFSFGLALQCDVFSKDAWQAPESYRYRNKNK